MAGELMQATAQRELREFVEQIEALQQQQRELGADVRDIIAAAKGKGYLPAIIRRVLAIRRKTRAEHEAEEAAIATYLASLGMENTPLGDYAKRQELIAAE